MNLTFTFLLLSIIFWRAPKEEELIFGREMRRFFVILAIIAIIAVLAIITTVNIAVLAIIITVNIAVLAIIITVNFAVLAIIFTVNIAAIIITCLLRFLRGEYDRLGPFSFKEGATAFYFVSLVTLWFFQVSIAGTFRN